MSSTDQNPDPVNAAGASSTASPGSSGVAGPPEAHRGVSRGRREGRRRLPILVVAAIVGALLSLLVGPGLSGPDAEAGDADLIRRVHEVQPDLRGYSSLSVVEITPEGTRQAILGEDAGHWELGSITKTFNGHLLADAVQRGEVRLDDPVERHLPELAGTEIGSVTLVELATHRGGVPRLLPSEAVAGLVATFSGGDPYVGPVDEWLTEAKTLSLSKRGEYAYSNTGAALLGQALARAAGAPDWPTLTQERLFTPLGMTGTSFATTPAEVPAGAATGHTQAGTTTSPWTSAASAPAGSSTFTSAADLTRYAQAVLGGSAPGMAAVEPRMGPEDPHRMGLHWFVTTTPDGRTLHLHDGGTAGARTMLILDRDRGQAVLVLGNSDRSVDDIGLGLMTGERAESWFSRLAGSVVPLVVLGLLAWYAWSLHHRARTATRRTQLVTAGLDLITIAILSYLFGPWGVLPGLLWGALVAVGVVGAVFAARRFGTLPWTQGRSAGSWFAVAASAVLLGALVWLFVLA